MALGARANGLVALDTALGANAASACARVDTLEVEASLGGAALLVLRALGVASGERIAQEVGRARADCAMVLEEISTQIENHIICIIMSTRNLVIDAKEKLRKNFFLIFLPGRCSRRKFRRCRKDLDNGSSCRLG